MTAPASSTIFNVVEFYDEATYFIKTEPKLSESVKGNLVSVAKQLKMYIFKHLSSTL